MKQPSSPIQSKPDPNSLDMSFLFWVGLVLVVLWVCYGLFWVALGSFSTSWCGVSWVLLGCFLNNSWVVLGGPGWSLDAAGCVLGVSSVLLGVPGCSKGVLEGRCVARG